MSGKLIAIEGPDGSGKTTARDFLAQELRARGYEVVLTREPGGTPFAERIRELLLTLSDEEVDPNVEAALFSASRKQHIERVIKPHIAKGAIVITDRFYWSSVAYQAFGRGLLETVSHLHRVVCKNFQADHTLLFQLRPEVAEARLAKRSGNYRDRMEAEEERFKRRVAGGYDLDNAGILGLPGLSQITPIDANGDIESVNKQLLSWIVKTFPVKENV